MQTLELSFEEYSKFVRPIKAGVLTILRENNWRMSFKLKEEKWYFYYILNKFSMFTKLFFCNLLYIKTYLI